ncbi:isocitrate dehydrogenase [NAD] subunit beta, mitochondrial-like isoform X2 [Eriocheir sinensis]|uniref:isocitrate dehydrogenase [NAD] subunit beta, mitochondrial-like isoform X2 n=1 Tax=Eriocheir sinensis TaxID=95602 RepID=UPI0021C8AECE|nr:isocitrate dehydrogenase [NAD] subunit beta, mitochondrial-like isoform X2 [Eriocheir sinensis]XP_050731563.1 isocitrate dehydrogenase [NAD] subunit beta, mitochondrial-like isoform X2 [Eriocheir sinensis]XP_050731564.1 isocitrate dehydrogenase [NAD] subunit beta, mitochondrial-like isoform X2 [Eriocheir sinensis]
MMAAASRRVLSSLQALEPMVRNVQPRSFHNIAPLTSAHAVPVSRPEGRTTATLVPGDGVGPELCQVVLDVFKSAGVPMDFKEYHLTELYAPRSDSLEDVVESIKHNGLCLKGILATPDHSSDGELKTLNMKLRDELDLYANVVHIKSLPGLNVRHKNVDMVVIREQTEGEYSALEHESVTGVVECLKIMTRDKCRRIAKFAFDYATKHGRKKVTAVHKANIMKLGDGLFLKQCEEVAEMYPNIEFSNMIIDNCTMQMVSNPHQFDVLVLPNLYGNIVDNLAAGLVGGAGVVAGASYSNKCVVFEPGARHTFSEAVGKNVANPTAMLLASANMLNHVNLQYYGDMIQNAVDRVIRVGKVRTKDMGGFATTSAYANAVIASLNP